MDCKTIEIRDCGTFIPALAIRLEPTNDSDNYLLSRAGFGPTPDYQCTHIILMSLNQPNRCEHNAHSWASGSRTMPAAHQWLELHFDEIESGEVLDVEFILGERTTKKLSERGL